MRKFLLALLLSVSVLGVSAQKYTISGRVQIGKSSKGVPMAVVTVVDANLWAITDDNGHFSIRNVQAGKHPVNVSCLGYVALDSELNVTGDRDDLVFRLCCADLKLSEVVVTARENRNSMSTSRVIDKAALDHLQMVNVSDVSSLLPGGKTVNPNLMKDNVFSIRDGGVSQGNASFGTAVEVDGVRLSTNASFGDLSGASTRNIASSNVESIEVITGIPSVEYGDLTSGLIKIDRRKGGNKFNARFKADTYGKLVYAGKGFEWEKRKLTLNVGIDFFDSKIDPRNSLENYKRLNTSVRLSKEWQYKSGSLIYASNLDYGGSFDNVKIDPEINYHKEDSYKSTYNRYAWANNLTWLSKTGRFFRSLELNTSVSLQKDVIDRTRYVSLSGPQPTPPLSTDEGIHDGTWLTPQYVATGGSESLPFSAFTKLVARFSAHGDRAQHDMLIGSDWQMNKNYGQGQIYDPLFPIYPSMTTRPRPYYNIPAGHDFSLFFEDRSVIPVARHKLEVQAGLRASTMLNLADSYALHGKFFFDPRVNLRWSFPRLMVADRPLQFEIGGGMGWHTMTPSLTYLYPDLLYYDWQQLNYYHTNPDYRRLNLKTYVVDRTNYDLQAARNFKWEVRGDISYGENRLSITYFREDITSGFRTATYYQPMSYRKYDATGLDPDAITAPPKLEYLPYTDVTAFGSYGMASNATRLFKEGVEYLFTSKRIPALRTRITIDGAWFRTLYSESEPYWYRPTVNLGGQGVPYVGYYSDPDGSRKISFNTRFMFDTYLPRLKLGFSAAIECMWLYRSWSLRRTGIPDEYMDLEGVRHPFNVDEARNDMYLQWLIITYPESNFNERIEEPFNVGMNLKVTKKFFKERIQLALFVDHLFSYKHEYRGLNGVLVRQMSEMPYFGMEINFNL